MAKVVGQNPWQLKLLRQQDFLQLGAKSDLAMEQSRVNSNVPYKGRYNIRLQRVLSNSKFPDNIEVIYAYPNPLSYTPRSQGEYRDSTQVVLTSFGIYYDAQVINAGRKVIDGGIVYSSEADVDRSFHSSNRMWQGIRSSIDPTLKLSGAHFYIDRLGNLVVMGDVDMAMSGDAPSVATAIFVAMEDAGYVTVDDWYSFRPNSKAIAIGENRNMQSFGFSAAQFSTLVILLRKLELAFPDIRAGTVNSKFTNVEGRAVSLPLATRDGLALKEITSEDPGGYITDAWPNYIAESPWESLFKEVDLQDQISEEDVFKEDGLFVLPWLGDVPPGDPDAVPTQELAQAFAEELKDQSAALQRVYNILNSVSKAETSEKSAKERLDESDFIGTTVANRVNLMESAENPSDGVPLFDTPEEDQDDDPTTCDAWEV